MVRWAKIVAAVESRSIVRKLLDRGRLSPESGLKQFCSYLSSIQTKLGTFQNAVDKGIAALEKELDLTEFLVSEGAAIETLVQRVLDEATAASIVRYRLGFERPDDHNGKGVVTLLGALCEIFSCPRAMLHFPGDLGSIFLHGFTPSEEERYLKVALQKWGWWDEEHLEHLRQTGFDPFVSARVNDDHPQNPMTAAVYLFMPSAQMEAQGGSDRVKAALEAELAGRRDALIRLVRPHFDRCYYMASQISHNAHHSSLRFIQMALDCTARSVLSARYGSTSQPHKVVELLDELRAASARFPLLSEHIESALNTYQLDETISPVGLFEVGQAVCRELAMEIAAQKIKVFWEIGTHVMCLCGEKRMREILYNLLENAVKYSRDGGSIHIEATAEMRKDNFGARRFIRISVTDQGIGIPADEYHKVFMRGHRAPNAKALGIEGTGVGLDVVKMAVESLTGEIKLKSVLHEGTTFTFWLPAAP